MSHWQFLNEKLGKDVVSHCIQPFLLPVNGMDIQEKRKLLQQEITAVMNLKTNGSDVPECIRDTVLFGSLRFLLYLRFRGRLGIDHHGSLAARKAKEKMISDFGNRVRLFMEHNKPFIPSVGAIVQKNLYKNVPIDATLFQKVDEAQTLQSYVNRVHKIITSSYNK